MSNWIDVNERLPLGDTHERVLVWEKYSDSPFVGFFSEGKWYTDKEHVDTNGNAIVVDLIEQEMITHWMPLPEPPEATDE